MKAGATFHFDNHLWMVISDPDQDAEKVLIVNFTTWRPRCDPACIVNPGEHPFINRQTCVNYGDALLFSVGQLAELVREGQIVPYPHPLSAELLAKIRQRAGESEELPIEYYNLLDEQWLITPF